MSYITELDDTYVAHTYARFPLEIVSGKGSILIDSAGREYIDMGTGIAVNSFGIGDPVWKQAVINQLDAVAHTSNLFYTQPCARLAQLLCERTGMDKVFFGNSGAEANECAIKVARKYSQDSYGEGRSTILTLVNSFHGRTLTTLAATGQEHYHEQFCPLTPGFDYVPADDIESLSARVLQGDVAALLIECVQGEGGVRALHQDYVVQAAQLCAQHDILFMVDEVQTGNGRSGWLYAYQSFGVKPDVVTTAKGLGAGLPIGACLMSSKVSQVLGPGDHGSTFGGNPVACAGATTIIERLDEDMLLDIRRKAAIIKEKLTGACGIEEVTGLGLMVGLVTSRPASEVILRCREQGVLCLTAKDRVRLLPALTIPDELLLRALDVIRIACA